MFQNKKLKRNATYAIAEVAVCASNCALPTSGEVYETVLMLPVTWYRIQNKITA